MSIEIVLATNNSHKAVELSQIFGSKIILKTLKDIKFTDKIIEDGNTFIDNALIKCKTVYDKIKQPVIADDSGLCVEALKGGPGIRSARYGNEYFTDTERYYHLLENLKEKTNLNASFVCALVLFLNPNKIYIVQDETKGLITFKPMGKNGFGYDPIFFLPQLNKTVAQLTDDEKNQISHRGKAARVLSNIINKIEF